MSKAKIGASVQKPASAFIAPKSERLSYYTYFVGQNIVYMLVTSFINVYFVMKLGISAAAVGVILLAARIWDAVNDPMFSVVVEKARLKGGKFKPWINTVAFLVPISTVLIFSFTDFLIGASPVIKIVYASITYVLWDMLYTFSDAPAYALATVMSPNPDERNTLIAFGRTFGFIGVFVAMGATMPLVNGSSWFMAAAILSACGLLLMLQVRRCKERIESTKQESPSPGEIVRAITGNKYLLVMVICMVFQLGLNFVSPIGALVAADVFGNTNLTSVLLLANLLPMIVIMPFTPKLVKKFGKINLYKYGAIVTIIMSVAKYLVGYENFGLFIGLTVFAAILTGFTLTLPALFFADCIEYYYCKTGSRFEAATFAAQTFANKALGALAGAGGMWILAALGYKQAIDGVAQVQTQQVVDGMWATYNLGSAVGSAIALVIFWFAYDLSESKLAGMKAAMDKKM